MSLARTVGPWPPDLTFYSPGLATEVQGSILGKESKLKYFKKLISGAIYDFLFWATRI